MDKETDRHIDKQMDRQTNSQPTYRPANNQIALWRSVLICVAAHMIALKCRRGPESGQFMDSRLKASGVLKLSSAAAPRGPTHK